MAVNFPVSPCTLSLTDANKEFHSIQYIEKTKGEQLQTLAIDIKEAKEQDKPKQLFPTIKTSPWRYPDTRIYSTASEVKEKIYYVSTRKHIQIKKQKKGINSFAAGVKCVFRNINKETILKSIKQHGYNPFDPVGVMDTLESNDIKHYTIKNQCSNLIIDSLAAEHPVLLCINYKNEFHTLIIYGAEFSIIRGDILTDHFYAFHFLNILDPATGNRKRINATELDGNILYALSSYTWDYSNAPNEHP